MSRNIVEGLIEDVNNQRDLAKETLAFEATELISQMMEIENVTKAELAKRIGRSRAYVTQLLSGARNITMHTLAELAFALGYQIELTAAPTAATNRSISVASMSHIQESHVIGKVYVGEGRGRMDAAPRFACYGLAA